MLFFLFVVHVFEHQNDGQAPLDCPVASSIRGDSRYAVKTIFSTKPRVEAQVPQENESIAVIQELVDQIFADVWEEADRLVLLRHRCECIEALARRRIGLGVQEPVDWPSQTEFQYKNKYEVAPSLDELVSVMALNFCSDVLSKAVLTVSNRVMSSREVNTHVRDAARKLWATVIDHCMNALLPASSSVSTSASAAVSASASSKSNDEVIDDDANSRLP